MSQTGSNAGGANGSGRDRIINRDRQMVIQITAQDGSTLVCNNVPRNRKLSVLFHKYCRKKQIEYRTARFLHEGGRVLGRYTPAELNLENGTEINCMLHLLGGGFYMMPATT